MFYNRCPLKRGITNTSLERTLRLCILLERNQRLARHLLRDRQPRERQERWSDVAERARMHLLDAVRDHDERHGVRRVLRERLVRLVVPHLALP